MRSVQVIQTTDLEQPQTPLQRRTDPPAMEGAHDELRASRGILVAVALGLTLWGLVILGIRVLLH
jgi:hypothetical protein